MDTGGVWPRLHWYLIVAVVIVSCGGDAGTAETGAVPTTVEGTTSVAGSLVTTSTTLPSEEVSRAVACSRGGTLRFSASFLEGPTFDADAFRATDLGQVIHTFFTVGEGSMEGGAYEVAEGFSVVTESSVLGYRDGLPVSHFTLVEGQVAGWGGCTPTWVLGDLATYRWHLRTPPTEGATLIALVIEGEQCPTASGTELTEVAEIEVIETADGVEILVWARPPGGGCLGGSGAEVDAVVELRSPFGNRELLDGGLIPPLPIEG